MPHRNARGAFRPLSPMRLMPMVLAIYLLAGPLQAQQKQLPDEEAILIMDTSELAAAAKNCKLEWQPYFDAFMAWQNRRDKWDAEEIKTIKDLFLFAQNKYIRQLPKDYCTAEQIYQIHSLTTERIGILENQ